MSAYLEDTNKVVHVVDSSGPIGGYEYATAFCGNIFLSPMRPSKGPASCKACKDRIAKVRESLKGVRFDGHALPVR